MEDAQPKIKSKEDKNLQINLMIESETSESTTRKDGSVICKLCGEILQSKTHWYRHKYQVHVIQPWESTTLFQCGTCQIYFRSRKGYLGHIASRHHEHDDCEPVPFSEYLTFTKNQETAEENKEERNNIIDHELAIPKSTVPTSNVVSVISKNIPKSKISDLRKNIKNVADFSPSWKEERSREEKLVADIIDRVKRECEAQGCRSGDPAKRRYSRKPTFLNT